MISEYLTKPDQEPIGTFTVSHNSGSKLGTCNIALKDYPMRPKRKSTQMMLVAVAMLMSACKPSISESDAIFAGYCTGIYPYAEVAIQNRFLNYRPGTFQNVTTAIERAFPAPVDWDADKLSIWRREMGRAQNHGEAIRRGNVQRSDITRLDACVEWAAAL